MQGLPEVKIILNILLEMLLYNTLKFSEHEVCFFYAMFSHVSLGEDEDSDAVQDASARDSEDEAEWDRLQADVKSRDAILDPKSKESHIVHAPYFPEVRIKGSAVLL